MLICVSLCLSTYTFVSVCHLIVFVCMSVSLFAYLCACVCVNVYVNTNARGSYICVHVLLGTSLLTQNASSLPSALEKVLTEPTCMW